MFFAREEILFPSTLDQALKPPQKPAALDRLWEKLAKGRGMVAEGEKHYSFSRPEAEAYASYYLPANALKTALVLEEAHLLGVDVLGDKAEWLDFGTGPGTAYWGLAWWAQARKKALKFTGWDQSNLFTDIASRLVAKSPFPARANFLAGGKEDAIALARRLQPTHISFVNSIAEIYPNPTKRLEACRTLLRILGDASAKDGQPRYLLIIEPGSRESSRELAELKDALKVPVMLPCLGERACGALAKPTDWCHEEVACRFPDWLNEMGEGAGLRKESMLFSYALIPVGVSATLSGSRVVSQRLERKGQVECWICSAEGKKFARVQRSKAPADADLILNACRGDIFSSLMLAEKGDLGSGALVTAKEKSIFDFA
jgi:hypothetical protein